MSGCQRVQHKLAIRRNGSIRRIICNSIWFWSYSIGREEECGVVAVIFDNDDEDVAVDDDEEEENWLKKFSSGNFDAR